MRSLVLVGHGSHLNPDSAGVVYRYAELARATGEFDEVLEVFWKEEPSLRQALRVARGDDLTVIPVFVSEGYFTETVIPRELGLGVDGPVPDEGVTVEVGGRRLHYTPPVGVHPAMEGVILARAREAVEAAFPGEDPAGVLRDTALVVLGHGTTRNRNSNRVIHQNAARLRDSGRLAEVVALFLDEDPRMTTWPAATRADTVVIVPFFTAEGWHTQETIPADLGLSGPVTLLDGRRVVYAQPVGTHPKVAEVLLGLAAGAGRAAPAARAGTSRQTDARQRAWAAVRASTRLPQRLGQLLLTPLEDGRTEVRNSLDQGRADLVALDGTESLRDRVRLADTGAYRPVHTTRDLPRGWQLQVGPDELERAVHVAYPAVVEESGLYLSGQLPVTLWAATASRQTGIYESVREAGSELIDRVRRDVCGTCLRTPLWHGEILERTILDGAPGGIPCAEACSLLVSEVRERVDGDERQS